MPRDEQYRLLWTTISTSRKMRCVSGDRWFRLGCHVVYTFMVAWGDGTSDITVTCPDNTNRNQVTLEFTPTEAGVVEIEAGAWYVSSTSQTVIIDDIEITQA